MIISSRITSKGQVTVPQHIRRKANFKAGDMLSFEFREDCVIIRKAKTLMDYVGYLGNVGTPDNIEEALTPEVVRSMLERE